MSKGGFFAGKLTSPDDTVEKGTRFDGATRLGKMYQERYFRPAYFEALEKIKAVAVRPPYGCPLASSLCESLMPRRTGQAWAKAHGNRTKVCLPLKSPVANPN